MNLGGLVLLHFTPRDKKPAEGSSRSAEAFIRGAARVGDVAAVQRLLERRDVNVNFASKEGYTLLMWAAGLGHDLIIKRLLDRGADPNQQDNYGDTALMGAATYGHYAVVKRLLDRGANPNQRNDDGDTALIGTVAHGHQTVAQLLLDRGADLHLKDKSGHTALLYAAARGHYSAAQLLLDHGAHEINAALVWAAANDWDAVVRLLLDRGADLNHVDHEFKQTALTMAAARHHYTVVMRLLDRGADPNWQDQRGRTTLMWVAEGGNAAMVQLLLFNPRYGVDLHKQDNEGHTALALAIKYRHATTADCIRYWQERQPREQLSEDEPDDVAYLWKNVTIKNVNLLEACNKFISALASGETLHIPSSEMPTANIPASIIPDLAKKLVLDLTRTDAIQVAGEADELQRPLPHSLRRWDTSELEWRGEEGTPKHYGDAKGLNSDLTIVEHLKSEYGPWVKSEHGLPRNVLLKLGDKPAYVELVKYLRDNALPPDVKVPKLSEYLAAQMPGDQEIRWAQRVVRQHDRRRPRNSDGDMQPIDAEEIRRARRIVRWHDRHKM